MTEVERRLTAIEEQYVAVQAKLEAIAVSVARIETKLENGLAGKNTLCNLHTQQLSEVRADVDQLRRWRWSVVGAVSAVVVIFQLVIPLIRHWLGIWQK